MRLLVEEEERLTRIAWPVPGGEWRRMGSVLLMSLGLVACGIFLWAMWRYGSLIGHFGFNVPFALLGAWIIGRHLLRLSRGRGMGLAEFRPELLHYESGGGWQVLDLRKGDCLSLERRGNGFLLRLRQGRETFFRYVLGFELGYAYWRYGIRIRLPGDEEAAALARAYSRWKGEA